MPENKTLEIEQEQKRPIVLREFVFWKERQTKEAGRNIAPFGASMVLFGSVAFV